MYPMITVSAAIDGSAWDAFLSKQRYRPFLQSWTMGEVYADIGQEPVRLEMRKDGVIVGICFGHLVNARRGRHLSVPYGPLFASDLSPADRTEIFPALRNALTDEARKRSCAFVRMSPFLSPGDGEAVVKGMSLTSSPLHLLAEHVWYLPLWSSDPWKNGDAGAQRTEEEILMAMRKTTRNLIRRAEKDGVTIEKSTDPVSDLEQFITLHDETRKRHGFTPYTNSFFRAQVKRFAARNECTVYRALYQGQVIASSVHMHAFGETSYHHGASADAFKKVPASYLLQWTAIKDALQRNDRVYNFWGIAPTVLDPDGTPRAEKGHPFAGVTLFKTGFGGSEYPLMHCHDLPVTPAYHLTRAIETIRKWKRGF